MISFSFLKKMNVESISNAWKSTISCEECSTRLYVFRKKKICFFCKNSFCQVCIVRREDKKLCCRKCQILTARPPNRNELLNLRSRDLVNYLTSRQIPTNGCFEKEDLVNLLMRAASNTCFHPSSNPLECSSSANSCPNTPRNQPVTDQANSIRRMSHSVENLYNEDGIRITGHNAIDDDEVPNSASGEKEFRNSTEAEEFNKPGQSTHFPSSNNGDKLSSHIPGTVESTIESDDAVLNKNSTLETIEKADNVLARSKPLMLSDIKSNSDLEALSVKQLKELLIRNRTDFKGCIERAELLQKANRLWSDYIASRKDLDNLSLDELCKICMDAPIECVLLECGHMATCTTCGKQLCECPICRQFVVRCVRTFKV